MKLSQPKFHYGADTERLKTNDMFFNCLNFRSVWSLDKNPPPADISFIKGQASVVNLFKGGGR